jgi:hypothetical protein
LELRVKTEPSYLAWEGKLDQEAVAFLLEDHQVAVA